ncbi:MAG: hypothetical protein M3290_08825, partial [Actinomycetota bacterium]|nr:hypothetical protein [Actinomycetota bacterium]
LKVHDGGGGTAATFSVDAGVPPFTVDSPTKVENLNADSLDGMDSSAFLGSVVVVKGVKTVAAGEVHSDFIECPAGYEALNGGVYSEEAAVVETIDSFPVVVGEPFFPPEKWAASARNIGNSSHEFIWYAVCSPQGGRP